MAGKNKRLTAEDAEERREVIKENIKKIKDNGLLMRNGPARGGHWEIVDV